MLLGTQMVAKGHHFEGVELAAVVDADTGLGLPDFRAEERTFQLITQLAGRSGRDAPGRVIVQTFQPDARPIVYAARHDVARFLTEELERREALGYPPFAHIVRIVVVRPERRSRCSACARGAQARPRSRAPSCSARRRCCVCADATVRSSSAKTAQPRRLATQAARLLSAAAPAMRRAGLTGGRRRRSAVALTLEPLQDAARMIGASSARSVPAAGRDGARPHARLSARPRPRQRAADLVRRRSPHRRASRHHGSMKSPRPEEIIGEWGVRDVTPPSQRERERLADDHDVNPLAGRPLRRRLRNFRVEADNYLAVARRAAAVHAAAASDRGRDRGPPRPADRGLRGGAPGTWAETAARWDFGEVNDLIERHNRWYPVEATAPDEPAHARLRDRRRVRLPSQAARRRLDPRPLPGRSVDCRADVGTRPRPRARRHDHLHDHEPRGAVRGRRGRGAAAARARADPAVRRSGAAHAGARGRGRRRRRAATRRSA